MRRRQRTDGTARRSGPPGEARWWDPDQQRLAEQPLLDARALGRGWVEAPMVNNAELFDPLADDEASAEVRRARAARVVTALDDGRAWRRRDGRGLVVLRVERYRDAEADAPSAHRDAWRVHGRAALEATWRQRWHDRGVAPGWVEAGTVPAAERPAGTEDVDWYRVEDHTDPTGRGDVTLFEHVTVWPTGGQVTATVRHPLGEEMDDVVAAAVHAIRHRLPD